MMLSIDTITESPNNARRIKSAVEADDALVASIREIGLLQPVLVVPHDTIGGRWELRAGHRRLAACRALGWTEIEASPLSPASDGVAETAISAAENMVRAAMHPVDQWRAIQGLRSANDYSIETAASALGVNLQTARRMEVLGRMAPEVLEEIAGRDMPPVTILARIATAPMEKQREAMERARSAQGWVDFFNMAEFCRIRRMPMTRAIFDPKLLTWDEDMFAEPAADDRFTTTEITEFMALQRTALEKMATTSKGRTEIIASEKLPPGWVRDFSGAMPKRFAKDDPRRIFALLRTEDNYQMGRVDFFLAHYDERAAASSSTSGKPEVRKPPINKTTLERLSGLKAAAVEQRLEAFKGNGVSDMLRALLMVFTFRNIGASPYNVVAHALVQENGDPVFDISDEELCSLAAWAINANIRFDHIGTNEGSGPGAEWLATAIGAEMPRTDTKEIMRGVSIEKLEEIAKGQGMTIPSDPKRLRKAMIGAMPHYRLANFGAPGPMPVEEGEGL